MMGTFPTAGRYGFALSFFWLHLHHVFAVVSLVGLILFTVWALRHLSAKGLRNVAVWFLAVGIAGALVTAPLAMSGFYRMAGFRDLGYGMMRTSGQWKGTSGIDVSLMRDVMNKLVKHDAGKEDADHLDMEDAMRRMMGPGFDEADDGSSTTDQ